ncbi:type 4a pilus biogenesis protein PilO [Candidatus Poribacteria bacterium]|nr:type 4a pilus biogenesis protein PilO [Candidatus Poribacteria bacterium]
MKKQVLLFLIFSIIAYEIYNIVTRRPLSTGTQYKKVFEKEKVSNAVLINAKTREVWENYRQNAVKLKDKENLINYLNKLALKNGILNMKIFPEEIIHEQNLLVLPIKIEMQTEYNRALNLIKSIENTPIYAIIDNLSMQYEKNNKIKIKINLKVQMLEDGYERYSSTYLKYFSSIPDMALISSSVRNPFNSKK